MEKFNNVSQLIDILNITTYGRYFRIITASRQKAIKHIDNIYEYQRLTTLVFFNQFDVKKMLNHKDEQDTFSSEINMHTIKLNIS